MRLLDALLTEARKTGRLETMLKDTEGRLFEAVRQVETLAKENIELEERLRAAEKRD